MAFQRAASAWHCLNPKCQVVIYGADEVLLLSRCPKCASFAHRETTATWIASMIAGRWLDGPDVEFPLA